MTKLSSLIKANCDKSSCCLNELIVLPREGDVGFEEYYEYKANMVKETKKIYSDIEQNKLMLAFPKFQVSEKYIFERFFESATIVARNRIFKGVFAIDLSAYINKTTDEHFLELMTYVQENPQTVFLFFIYSDNSNEIDGMYNAISQYHEIRKQLMELPNAKQLTKYTESKIRDFSLHVTKEAVEYIEAYYLDKRCGYEAADFLIKYLKNEGYQGDLEMLKKITNKIDESCSINRKTSGFGY